MILVVGATGLLGGMITRQLLEKDRDVRILVRHNSPSEELAKQGMATPAPSLIEAGAHPVSCDLKDPASLDAACAGIETLITTANSALCGGEDNVQAIEFEGNHHLIQAAKAAGVKHFIFTSVLGASPEAPRPFVQGKAKTEERLRASGLDYTILAPNFFIEVWVGMVVRRATATWTAGDAGGRGAPQAFRRFYGRCDGLCHGGRRPPGGAECLPAHRWTRRAVVARHRGRVWPGRGARVAGAICGYRRAGAGRRGGRPAADVGSRDLRLLRGHGRDRSHFWRGTDAARGASRQDVRGCRLVVPSL